MNDDRLATEILHELKKQNKRLFIALVIAIVAFFVTNGWWLQSWNEPTHETTVTQDTNDGGNNFVNTGEYHGETNGKDNK